METHYPRKKYTCTKEKQINVVLNFNFPDDWYITYTENHWANTSTPYSYVDNIIIPYVLDIKDKLDLLFRQKSLIILDFFSEDFRHYMLSKNHVHVYICACWLYVKATTNGFERSEMRQIIECGMPLRITMRIKLLKVYRKLKWSLIGL